MAHIITLTNQKGGVGKTTSTATLISGLTANQHKVLGIDLDPQGNLGFSLGIELKIVKQFMRYSRGNLLSILSYNTQNLAILSLPTFF